MSKPLGMKAYGSIGHLPNSRMGPSDHHAPEGQARICLLKVRDRHDLVLVQEKLDGSCTAAARIADEIVALGRAGWLAESSPYEQHRLFAAWVRTHEERFRLVLRPGERLVGEWLAQAHGTRYNLPHEPWVCFDLMEGHKRATYSQFVERVRPGCFITPRLIHSGASYSLADLFPEISFSGHGAIDPVKGAVWRVERAGCVDFLAKWVRPDKVDGLYLPEVSGQDAIWNWRPDWD